MALIFTIIENIVKISKYYNRLQAPIVSIH